MVNRKEVDKREQDLRSRVTYISNRLSVRFTGMQASVGMPSGFDLQFTGDALMVFKAEDDPETMVYDYECILHDAPMPRLEEALPLIPRIITSLENQCELRAAVLDALGQEADKILKGLPTPND